MTEGTDIQGTAAIDWLIFHTDIISRSEALLLCQQWMDAKRIYSVIPSDLQFVDDHMSFYQFSTAS